MRKRTLQEKCLTELLTTASCSNSDFLVEASRTSLITQSKSVGYYKNRERGKNRFERKKYSKIANDSS